MLDIRPDQPMAGSQVSIPESTSDTVVGTAEPERVDAGYVRKLMDKIEAHDFVIEKAEQQLKYAKEAKRKLVEEIIPEAMDEVGMGEMKTTEGDLLFIDEKTRCSIKAKQKFSAYQWLDDNGHGKMIKRVLIVDLGADSTETDEKCREAIQTDFLKNEEEGAPPAPDMKTDRKVEPSTLTSFADKELKAGRELPEEFFSVYIQRIAKVKAAKKD